MFYECEIIFFLKTRVVPLSLIHGKVEKSVTCLVEQNGHLKCLWLCGRVSGHSLKPEALLSWWQQCYYPVQGRGSETTWNLAWGPELNEAAADTDIFSAFLTSVLRFRGCSRAPTMPCSALKKADSQQCGVVQPQAELVLQWAEITQEQFFITDMVIIGQVFGYTAQEEPQDTPVFYAMITT